MTCEPHIHRTDLIAKCLLLFMLIGGSTKGQSDTQLWTNLAINTPLDDHVTIGGDIGWRGLTSNRNWNQFLFRPTATYRFRRFYKVSAGFAVFSTINQDDFNVNEFRLNQDFNITWPNLGWSKLYYRVRFEERWFYYQKLPNDFSMRGRLLMGIQSKDVVALSEKRPFYGSFSLEGFIPFESNSAQEVFINNFRTDLAIGHRILPSFRYELHYIAQLSKLFASSGSQEVQHIFRIRMFLSLDPPEVPDEIVNPDGG